MIRRGRNVVKVLWKVREKVEMGRQRAGGLRVPLLAEAFGSMKFIYMRDLRAAHFSLCRQKCRLPKGQVWDLVLTESDSW